MELVQVEEIERSILGHTLTLRNHRSDNSIFHELYVNDEYHIRPIRAVHTALAGAVIDVGAHAGVFSVMCSMYWPDSKIVSIEPHPRNWEFLVRNTQSLPNVVRYNRAIGKENGDAHLIDCFDGNTGGSSTKECRAAAGDDASSQAKLIDVKSITLSNVIREQGIGEISILKLDCETGEYAAVEDLYTNGLLRQVCWIRGEYHLPASLSMDALDTMVSRLSKTHEVSVTPPRDPRHGLGLFVAHRKAGA